MKSILRVAKEAVDFTVFLLLAALVVVISAPLKIIRSARLPRSGFTDIIHVSNAMSISSCLKKYGTMEYMYNYAGKMKDFRRNIFIWCPVEKFGVFADGDWIFYDRPPVLKYLRWTAVFLHTYIAALRYFGSAAMLRSWGPYYPGIPVMLASMATGIPYCVSLHADYDVRYRLAGAEHSHVFLGSRRLGRFWEKLVMKRSGGVMAQLGMHKRYAESLGVPARRITFIYHGINLRPFMSASPRPETTFKFPSDKKIVSMAARITKDNYADDSAAIARGVLESRGDVRFIFAGDGDMLDALKIYLDKYIRSGDVLTPGFIAHVDVVELRKRSAVNLCLMAGFSLLEACAGGRPAVAYDIEWHSEIIEDGKSGFLVKEGDIPAAVSAVNRLLDDENLSARLGAEARRRVFERHDIEMSHERKNEFYLKIASGDHGGRGRRT